MKLADLIPSRTPLDGNAAFGWNVAVDAMARLIADAESKGYRLVLAMPQHIEPMEDIL